MTRILIRTTAILGLTWLCASPAAAQSTPIDEARAGARIHFGGVYMTPTLQLKELGLDSNVFNQTEAQTPDFTVTLTPGARLAVPIARRALVAGYVDTDLVYYQKYASQRSVNPNVSLRATGFLHRLTLFTEGTYLNTRERLNQEVDARARRVERAVGAGLEMRVVPKFSVGLSANARRIDFADDQFFRDVNLRAALANDSRSVTASVSYKVTPLTTLSLKADASHTRFLLSPLKDTDSVGIMPGVEFKPRALISGSAYVGFRRFQPLNPLVPEYRGAVASLSLRYSLRSATAFTITVDRDTNYSYQEAEPYFINTAVGLSIRRQIVGPFDATAGIQRFQNRYQDLQTSPLHTEPPRVDVTHNYSGDIGYRLGRKGRLGIRVSYWDRDSNRATDVAYSGFRLGSIVSYGF